MTGNDNPSHAASPLTEPFRAILTPHRSLGPRGFVILMTALCLINFAVGIAFWLMGAWPVLLFCGLDVALIYLAFKINYRAGRAYETVDLTPELLTVTSVTPSGSRRSLAFNPYWVRVALHQHHDGRTELELAHHDQRLVFARCLNDDEKRAFADALRTALARSRTSVGF